MIKHFIFTTALVLAASSPAQTPSPAMPSSGTVTIQEMLVTGHSGLKLHSLAMITQGKVTTGVDESFLPGFKTCANDTAAPVRSITARLLGQHFVQNQDQPNPEAVALLTKLSQDETQDVRYNAVYFGLSQIKDKSSEIVDLLINLATTNRDPALYERIIESLEPNQQQVTELLDKKLAESDNVAFFEIYKDFTGKTPALTEKFMNMPSSRPRVFVFNSEGSDAEANKAKLEKELIKAGLQEPDVLISGSGENHVLLVKTYLVKDYKAVETNAADHSEFKLSQSMWLTPQLETQIDALRKTKK